MKRTELRLVFASPEAFAEEPIKICGWLRTSRNSKSIGFIELNDGTCFSNIQVVYEEDKVNNFKEINMSDKKSTLKIILIVSAAIVAIAAAVVGVYFYVNRKVKSVVIGKLDFDGDGEIDAIMLDTTGNGEVDTIILNSDDE